MAIFDNPLIIIQSGGGGADLNIEYNSSTAPSDTTKLWVKSSQPDDLKISTNYENQLPNEIEELGSLGNKNISYSGICSYNDKIYIVGGNNSDGRVYVYDTTTNTYTILTLTESDNSTTQTPFGSYPMSCAIVGTIIYCFYMVTGYGHIDKIDLLHNTITRVINNNIGSACSCVAIGTDIYVFGGSIGGNSYSAKIISYNTLTDIATVISSMDQGVGYMGIANVGDNIYLVGGTTRDSNLRYMGKYDIVNNSFTRTSIGFSYNAYGMSCCTVGELIYITGGSNSSHSTDINVFNPATSTLTKLAKSLYVGGQGIGLCFKSGSIYIISGYNTPNIYKFMLNLPLTENNMLLVYDIYAKWSLINSNNINLKINPIDCYLGDSNNIGQQVKIALYDETLQDWVEIN